MWVCLKKLWKSPPKSRFNPENFRFWTMAFPKFSDKPIRSTTIYIYHPNSQWVWINTEYIKMDGLESTGATWYQNPWLWESMISTHTFCYPNSSVAAIVVKTGATGPSAKVKSLCYPLLSRPWTLVILVAQPDFRDPCFLEGDSMICNWFPWNNPTIHDMIHDPSNPSNPSAAASGDLTIWLWLT